MIDERVAAVHIAALSSGSEEKHGGRLPSLWNPRSVFLNETFSCSHAECTSMTARSLALTPEVCEAFCTSLRYPFFALLRSSWCRCGTMTRHTRSSARLPSYADEAHVELETVEASMGGKPWPGAMVGDSSYACMFPCAGDKHQRGCGGERSWDLYAVTEPCVLYRECDSEGNLIS